MARRKKEPQSVHRKAIALVAQDLFLQKWIEHTSMDDIAKISGYSKATWYVYFKSKEILTSYLVLQSMPPFMILFTRLFMKITPVKNVTLVFAIHFMNIKSSTHCTSH